MEVERLRELAEREPFRPFGLRLDSGTEYWFREPREFRATRDYSMIFYLGGDVGKRIDREFITEILEGAERDMPELSRFYGIIIRMFVEPSERHHTPHFHAYYQGDTAVFSIEEVELLAGAMPRRQQRLVEAWAELHQEELRRDWQLLQQGRAPEAIPPLN